ncbi:hypothetical protein INS49_015427 [Diaporthe citri]|uniref:uncharacterized protein n=1 Tax=Diaporthe citri TaxID=83186 RepID=UPI001C80104D|nr:uncharacterized protein INS49_015427 [Diaporthe citri]KAG6356042.1 hypothetical protein INS49_015427 [Diaporthe citri]
MPSYTEPVSFNPALHYPPQIHHGGVITESSSSSGDSPTEEETIQDSQVGMTAESKNLYREDPRLPWQELSLEEIGIDANAISASNKFALVVRREKRIGDTDQPAISLHSITIQSPLIKALLGPVFADYQGINTSLKRLEFIAPFHEFFYRWTEFTRVKGTLQDATEVAHYGLLFDIVSNEITPHIEQAGDLVKNGVISFEYLWSLFEPGTEIYSRVDEQDRLYLLLASRYVDIGPGMRIFSLTCRYVETDGTSFGFTTANLTISSFANVKPISDLNVLPSHLKSDIDGIRTRLYARGMKFEQLNGFHHKSYNGFYNFLEVPFGGSNKRYVQNDAADGKSFETKICSSSINISDPTVKGFCLRAKQWGVYKTGAVVLPNRTNTLVVILYIDSIGEIEWSSDAFKQLVLPHDYKRIVWAFVEAQISQQDTFDDLVRGKGKGFIMLLSGEPGTGKTLTAESVADAMEKPLYSMSAGELGNQAVEVERNLQRVLELSTKWGAVLLLDECDVFMVKRSSSDLHRNQLVSVFLRLLEYYEGVMFLTTNRIESFDPAFESRIHLTINYPKLDQSSRLHIWRTFASLGAVAGSTSELDEESLLRLAEAELNGRQIKNVVKTARLLAAGDKTPLRLDHIETVMRVKRGDRAYVGGNGSEVEAEC